MSTTLWRHARLAAMTAGTAWGWVDDAALLVDGDTLRWVGPDGALPAALTAAAASRASRRKWPDPRRAAGSA